MRAAKTAPDSNNSGDRRIGERLTNRLGAPRGGASNVTEAREHRIIVNWLKSKALDFGEPGIELLEWKGTGWRHDGEAAARLERPGFCDHRNRAISSAMARWSSRPRHCRSALPSRGRGA